MAIRKSLPRMLAVGSLTTSLLWACHLDSGTAPTAHEISLKPGGGGPPVKVDQAVPDSGEQGTQFLTVRVSGSGYDPTATVQFLIDGGPQTDIATLETRFVDDRNLDVDIAIEDSAALELYDIEVNVPGRGKKGTGADLFRVVQKSGGTEGPPLGPEITVEFADRAGDEIVSDGRLLPPHSYEEGVCGVRANFNLTDARLDPDADRIRKKDETECGGSRDPRFISVAFVDRVVESPAGPQDGNTVEGGFMIVHEVETVTLDSGTVERRATFHQPGCAMGLTFDAAESGGGFTVNSVDVTKNADGSWTVETKAAPNNVAVCRPDESSGVERSYYHMDFRVTVRHQ